VRRPSNTPFYVAGAIALLGIAGMNYVQYQNRPKSNAELNAEDAEREARNPKKPETPPPGANDPGAKLAALGSVGMVGSPAAPKQLTLGYHWTPEVQSNPMRVYGPVEMIAKMNSQGVAVKVVCLDDPDAPKVPEGISFRGQSLVPLRPQGGFEPEMVQQALPRLMQSP